MAAVAVSTRLKGDSMSSSKLSTSVVLALALSAGALSIPRAEAAPVRNDHGRTGAAIQQELSARMLLQSVKDLLHIIFAGSEGPPGPGNNDVSREGSGLCPNGRPRGLQPGGGH